METPGGYLEVFSFTFHFAISKFSSEINKLGNNNNSIDGTLIASFMLGWAVYTHYMHFLTQSLQHA